MACTLSSGVCSGAAQQCHATGIMHMILHALLQQCTCTVWHVDVWHVAAAVLGLMHLTLIRCKKVASSRCCYYNTGVRCHSQFVLDRFRVHNCKMLCMCRQPLLHSSHCCPASSSEKVSSTTAARFVLLPNLNRVLPALFALPTVVLLRTFRSCAEIQQQERSCVATSPCCPVVARRA